MRISQDIRDAESEKEIKLAMEEKSKEFDKGGRNIYNKI
jgi:hypothetical protein